MRWAARCGLVILAFAAAAVAASQPADAHRYRHGGSSLSIGLGFYDPYPYRPYYHRPYYYQPPVVYAPPPVVYQAPVYHAPAAAPELPPVNRDYCREYQSTADVGGQIQEVVGTVCRQPDGSWRIVR